LAEATLNGTVANSEGAGQAGVQIKIFIDGFVRADTVSGPDGAYTLPYRYDPSGDQTIVVWYLPTAGLVPEMVVLRESARAKEMGLWSPCVARVPIAPSVEHNVTLYTESGKFDALSATGCL
jgi:hypothetical protein